ncbi:MAG: TolC family protein [Bacteroidota bacterium]|nr:TolC family protein [Bacteroidota bacterium]
MKYNILPLLLMFLLGGSPGFTQDRNLDYYLQISRQNSPLLKDYHNQQLKNKADNMRLQASFGPQAYANMNAMYAPIIKGWGYDEVLSNHQFFNAVVGVSYPIIERKNINNQRTNLTIQNSLLDNQLHISQKDLIKEVTSQYIRVYGDGQEYEFNSDIYDLLQKEENILKKLTNNSVYKQTDYLTFLVTLKQQKMTLLQIRAQQQCDLASLNYLCGTKDTSCVQISTPQIVLSHSTNVMATLFYKKFETDSLRLGNEDAAIDFSYHPKMNFIADAGYNSSFIKQPYKNFGPSVTLNVSIPLYDGHQRKFQHRKISLDEDTRQEYQKFFINQYNQQMNSLLQQLKSTEALISQSAEQIKLSEALIKSNQKLLSVGDIRITDYLLILQNYLNAKNSIIHSEVDKLQIINQINYWNSIQ